MGDNLFEEALIKYSFGCESFIIDESFDSSNSENYHLSVQLGLKGISFCVLDTLSNKYLALYNKPITATGFNDLNSKWLDLKSENELLKLNYLSAKFCIINDQSTIVPSALYDPSKENKYLNFNLDISQMKNNEEFIVERNKINSLDAYHIFRIPKKIYESLTAFSEKITLIHIGTSLIETLITKNKNQDRSLCFLNFEKGLFFMVVIEGNNLKFYNSYEYATKEDLAYYVLFVFEQLKLNPESMDFQIMGEIERKSDDYSFLYQYIRNLSFVNRNEAFNYSYHIEELPEHFHYNLFSQYHCAL